MTHPLVSIIVVTFNSQAYIQACLSSVLRLSYKPLEVIVVDNASTDETQAMLKSLQKHITIVQREKNIGYAAANNRGIQQAKGKYILLINPDAVATPNMLLPLVEEMEKDTYVGACQPLIYLSKDKNRINLWGKRRHFLGFDWIDGYRSTEVPPKEDIVSFSGAGVLFRASVLRTFRAFDETYFMYYEDSDLSWRMQISGVRMRRIPESVMFHDYKFIPNSHDQSLQNKLYLNERNRIMNLLKNYEIKTLVLLFPIFMLTEFGMMVFALQQGWLAQKLKGYRSILVHLPHILKERALVQGNRKVSDRSILSTFESQISFIFMRHPLLQHVANPSFSAYWRGVRAILELI